MAASKGGYTYFLNYNTAKENNVSKGMSGPAPLPPTPLLSEKKNFTRCTLPSEIIELTDDGGQNPRDPHQHAPSGRLHQTPLTNQPKPGFTTPHLMSTPSRQQTARISQPDLSFLNLKMLPQMGPYQPEPLPSRTNQSGLVFSSRSSTGMSNGTLSHTGSPSVNDLLGTGRTRSETGVSNLMMTPQMGPYRAGQHQNIAKESNISSYPMPPHTRQLDCTSTQLDSGLSSLNFGMPPQLDSILTRPDVGYPPVTTSCQIGPFQMEKPEYSRTHPDMSFPSSVMSHLMGRSDSEHPNGSTNGSCMGFPNMYGFPKYVNSGRTENQSSTKELGSGTSFPNLVVTQPQVNSSQYSAFLTTPNTEPGSTLSLPPQGSEQERTLYQEMVPTEEVATNQVIPENQGIDLNKTPQQKPRRRKYVPKVVTEGKKPRGPKKTTPKKASEDRPKRKYVRKKGLEPSPVETPINTNGAGKPVEGSNLCTQIVANLQSNQIESPLSGTPNAPNWQNKTNDLPASSTINAAAVQNEPIEASNSCNRNSVNGHNNLAEVPMPCTPNVTNGLNNRIDMAGKNPCHTASGPKGTTRKKASEDRPKRKYVRKKDVESSPVETPVNADGAGKPVEVSNLCIHTVANLQSNQRENPLSCTPNAPNWQNKTNEFPASSTLNKPVEASNSCTPNAVNGHNKLAEIPMPCTPNVTNGLSNRIDVSSLCTPKSSQGAYTVVQTPGCRTVSGMSGSYKSVRRCLNFDAEEVRPNEYNNALSQANLNPVSAPPARTNISTSSITTSSFQVGPSPSKGIAVDLNSSASQWQEEFDRLFPPAPSTNIGGAKHVLGTNQTRGRNMSNANRFQTGLGILTGYPYPPLPCQTNNNIVAPRTPLIRSQMGVSEENLAALDLMLESQVKAAVVPSNSYSNAPSVISVGRKRDHGTIVSGTGLIETSKKIRIWNGNNTGQNGAKPNASLVPNSSPSLPPVRPNSGSFSFADAQRLVELHKRNNTKMLSLRIPEGNTEDTPAVPSGPACTTATVSTSECPVVTSDMNWFMHSTLVKPAPAVSGTSRAQVFVEGTATLNQYVNTSGTQSCSPINPVVSGVNGITLETITGSTYINLPSTQPVDHINEPHVGSRTDKNENCQVGAIVETISETTTKKPEAYNCPPPNTPEKSPILNAPPKSEPKRRGRRPKSEKSDSNPPVPPRPKGRPRGRKSSLNSASLMVGDPAALAYTLDLIIQKMNGLDINRISGTELGQQCYALVPYQGGVGDGKMVPYDDSTVKKKKKPRARVKLDPVTSQVWDLLMGKEMKDRIENVNENDEKVMEAEREVFRGRVDSFIARMHLVQGDRRFSPWKGSVVDSVVGVFLTQNVSDHLSSSAFMALAAKYPPKADFQNSQPRETVLSVSRPRDTNPYARDFINLTKWHHQREVIIEDFTDVGSQVTLEEKDSNESQGSTTKWPSSSPEKKSTGSPDSGPGLIINFASDDPMSESVVSSQNSVVSNQSSPDYLFQTEEQNLFGLGLMRSSYTQLMRMADSNGVDLFPDLNEETDAMGGFHSSEFYPQMGNNYSVASSTINSSNMHLYPQNGVYSPAVPARVNGNKISETFQTQHGDLRIRTIHSPMVSQTTEPMIKITTPTDKTHGFSPVQEGFTRPPTHQPQSQAQSTPRASNLQNTPNANSNNNSKASSETVQGKQPNMAQKAMDGTVIDEGVSSKGRKGKGASGKGKKNFDWDSLRRAVLPDGVKKERTYKTMDSLDYQALRNASVNELSDAIRERGMNNMLAERIKGFLDRLVEDHGSVDLEWLRDVDPDKAKDYLLSIRGLGLKSVECVRLLTLHHMAFPVDTNVGRICVRLGWVPLQPLPESLQLHLLEMYPILENIQKYLWPRLCKFDQRTLYELHYQMITFGKVFCTKSKPNCNACPMRAECKHFASAFASARLALPAPEEKGLTPPALPAGPSTSTNLHRPFPPQAPPPQIEGSLPLPIPYLTPLGLPFQNHSQSGGLNPIPSPIRTKTCNEPIIEEPASPEPEPEPVAEKEIGAIEDAFMDDDPDEIPVIKLDFEEFAQNLKNYIQANNLDIEEADMSKAMVAISPAAASIPMPKLKNISRLRTEHHVYELPDNHTLLDKFEPREPDDPCPYLLSVWTPGETAMSTEPPKSLCISQDIDELCNKEACARCVSIKEARNRVVRGTILIPCRTAMRGSFPLNGTYFQVNEVFADHETSRTPVDVSRVDIWNLHRRMVYFGTSIPTIFKGLSTEEIQHCFWRGFVCVRGFDRATRAPRPLYARLHFPASKLTKNAKKPTAEKDKKVE